MSQHCGYVIKIEKLRPHTNADKLQILEVFGTSTVVGLNTKIGDIGIYFPTDLQLSEEYCDVNDLCRERADGSKGSGYLERKKRNVGAVRLRGERSDGLYMPLSSLEFTGVDLTTLTPGTAIDIVNGHPICQKYIPCTNSKKVSCPNGNHTRKKKAPIAPLFIEHADTEQLPYNLSAFKEGDYVEITLKMHGTSARTAHLPILKGYKRSILDRLLRREGKPIYEMGYVSGTRRTILENFEGGYYGSNSFRESHAKFFEGKLLEGEEVYYEIVGFTDTGIPIMPPAANSKLNDKEFIKQYGETTIFSYGCSQNGKKRLYDDGHCLIGTDSPQSDIYVYRMTMTTSQGDIVEYTPDMMRFRCEEMNVKYVPLLWRGIIPSQKEINTLSSDGHDFEATPGGYIQHICEQYYDGPDPVGKSHIREGVVARIVNRRKFCAYKLKNFSFKCLEGIIKATAEKPDIEEAEEL